MSAARITVQDLTKVFALRRREKTKGLSTDSLAPRTLRSQAREALPERGSANHLFALDGISFDVEAGEVLGIIGRNGAGKTTLLRILARVLDPTAGRAMIHGRVVSLLELGIGFAPDLTVRQNIEIYGRLAGIRPRRIRAAEEAILEFAELTDYREVPLVTCPSGSFVRLAFSAMVNLDTDIILADEVLAVGDSAFRHACEARIRAVGESGESVLFVSHDMNAIRRCCTRVIWIDRGHVCRVGPTEEIVRAYRSELLAGRLLPTAEGDLGAGCRLLDVHLLDGQRAQVGALQMTEAGYIECLFRIDRPEAAVTVQIELWQGKHHVMTSATQRPITVQAPTTLRAGIRVPPDMLNEMPYRAHCRLYAEDRTDHTVPTVVAAEAGLDFVVMNPRPQDSVWADWRWGRSGVISPRLQWTASLEEPAPHA